MRKLNYLTSGFALASLFFCVSAAAAENAVLKWQVTVDQKQAPKKYNVVTSFINAVNNTVLGSTAITYPEMVGEGGVSMQPNSKGEYPVGYIQASVAQLGASGDKSQYYSVNCYDLNIAHQQAVYLNFPQDFTNNKPVCPHT